MNSDKPYAPPSADDHLPQAGRMPRSAHRVVKAVGSLTLASGLVAMTYGVIGMWLIPSLPPNGGPDGRLPSVLITIGGMVAALVGMSMRDLRLPQRAGSKVGSEVGPEKDISVWNSIPTRVGFVLLVVIMAIVVVAIARS